MLVAGFLRSVDRLGGPLQEARDDEQRANEGDEEAAGEIRVGLPEREVQRDANHLRLAFQIYEPEITDG
ncbi:hypothetical protein HWV23_14315 [Natronomonas halophila]|uniref:hypothetical protein n=1 Tax=Natronomonas halophila TaxID=2747817 RepID=UPI0015B3EF26|nr:hypothetical protein [Natronomonas halophila]QLD86847.1 hypothetical protein HWV23_14315 [Natronomonas halophila]